MRLSRGGFTFDSSADPSRARDTASAAIPRLSRSGSIQYGGVRKLVDEGWSLSEVRDVVDAFPDARYTPLTMIVSLAGELRRRGGVENVREIIAWLHAMLSASADGTVSVRGVVRDVVSRRLDAAKPMSLVSVPGLWAEAAGTSADGLAALAAGLTLTQTSDRYGSSD